MARREIRVCPSTLGPGFNTYSPAAQAALFGSRSRKVWHTLPFGPPNKNTELDSAYHEKWKVISISGGREKYALRQDKNNLILTDKGGTHILKPVPIEAPDGDAGLPAQEPLDRVADLPANEHVSMQIARQVFGVRTAHCGMIFFSDGSPAFLSRRFDYKPDGLDKYQVEDFATLLGKTFEREGDGYQSIASYLDIANLIGQYAAAAPVVLLDFFRRLVVNYLIANGNAHLKKFSLMETAQGDFVLSPAYGLLCTALHVFDNPLGLSDGLYCGDSDEKTYNKVGAYTGTSFLLFAQKAGISSMLAGRVVDEVVRKTPDAIELVQRSFLSAEAKSKYIEIIGRRHRMLAYRKG
jgi:serine/threonine-protein kinase HipA